MIKLIGSALTILAGFVMGAGGAKKLWKREELLRHLASSVSLMKAQLEARQPMVHICAQLENERGQAGMFFRELGDCLHDLGETGLGQAWASCAEKVFGADRELSSFASLGMALGSGQAPTDSLCSCIHQLNRAADRAADRARRDGNMFTALGISLSAALVIVLV